MAAPIEIPIASETKAFRMGVENGIIDPLEDAEQTLRDLAKGGDRAGDELEDALRTTQKETKESAKELERLAGQIEQTGRKGRDIESGVRSGTDGAVDAVQEFGDEAKQNLSETVSSFRGDASDLAQIVQDTFGGVVSNLGPLGAAAGVAGAIGIGLMMKGFEEAEEAEQEFRERVQELAQVLIETGGEGADALDAVAGRLMDMVAPADENAISLSKLRREAELSGVEFRDLANAYAGAGGDLGRYIEQSDEAAEAAREAMIAAQQSATESVISAAEQYAATSEVSQGLRDLADAQAEAAEEARLFNESGLGAAAARAEQMRALQGELDEAMGAWGDYQDKETGALDPAGFIAGMQARMDATSNFNGNVKLLAEQFGLTFEEQQAILDQGVDFAPMLQSILDSGMGEQYAAQVRSMLDGGQAIIDGTPTTATVTTQADTTDAEAAIDAAAGERTAPIEAEAATTTAAKQLDAVAAQARTAKITAQVDLTAAERALNDWIARQRTVNVTVAPVDREGRPVP